MTVYIIKSIICSGILLMFYQLLLKREKMHHFNRFYLIGSIAFSLLIPFVSIELPAQHAIQESYMLNQVSLANKNRTESRLSPQPKALIRKELLSPFTR
jgi:bla regulator protein BlaR1